MEKLVIKPAEVAEIVISNINNQELLREAIDLLKVMEGILGVRTGVEITLERIVRLGSLNERNSISLLRSTLEQLLKPDVQINGKQIKELREIKSKLPAWAISIEKDKVSETFKPASEEPEPHKITKVGKLIKRPQVNEIIAESPRRIVMDAIAGLKNALMYMDMIVSNEPDEALKLDEAPYRIKFQILADASEIVRSWNYRTIANEIMRFKNEISQIFDTIIESINLYTNGHDLTEQERKELKNRIYSRLKTKIEELEKELVEIPVKLKKPTKS